MKLKMKVFLALLCVGVIILGAFAFLAGRRKFPMWEMAEEKWVDSGVVLTFLEIKQEKEYDVIFINLRNEGEWEASYGICPCLEYLEKGVWYTVYEPGGPLVDILLPTQEEAIYRCRVPSGLLDAPGRYRVYVDGIGYCEIPKETGHEK